MEFNFNASYCPECGIRVPDITVSQYNSSRAVLDKPEWRVVIYNNCNKCSMRNLAMTCAGFQSAPAVDPALVLKSGDTCLINGGRPILRSSSFTFYYVWDTTFEWEPVSGSVECSQSCQLIIIIILIHHLRCLFSQYPTVCTYCSIIHSAMQ